MSTLFEDANGNIMAGDRAGGIGGGVTSYVTRAASEAEKTQFHETRVRNAAAAVDTAQLSLTQAQDAHKAHVDALPAANEARLAEEAAARDADVKSAEDRRVAARVAAEQEDRRDRQVAAAGATPAHTPEPFVHPEPGMPMTPNPMANPATPFVPGTPSVPNPAFAEHVGPIVSPSSAEREAERVRQAQVGAQESTRAQQAEAERVHATQSAPIMPMTPNPRADII